MNDSGAWGYGVLYGYTYLPILNIVHNSVHMQRRFAFVLYMLATPAVFPQAVRIQIGVMGGALLPPLGDVMKVPCYGAVIAVEPGTVKPHRVRGWIEVGYLHLSGEIARVEEIPNNPSADPYETILETPDVPLAFGGAGLRYYANRNNQGFHLGLSLGAYYGRAHGIEYEYGTSNGQYSRQETERLIEYAGLCASVELGHMIGPRVDLSLRYSALSFPARYKNGVDVFGDDTTPSYDLFGHENIMASMVLVRATLVLFGKRKPKSEQTTSVE